MRTFVQETKTIQRTSFPHFALPNRTHLSPVREAGSNFHPDIVSRNDAIRQPKLSDEQPGREAARFGHDFSRMPVNPQDGGGLKTEAVSDTEDVGGRTAGEFLGDIGRPVGSFFGNLFGGIVGAVAGNSISSVTTTPPRWNPHGNFLWEVGFNTSGRNGWIVQEIDSTRRAQDAAGHDLPDPLTRRYWEAWAVDAAGNVTPAGGPTNDTWARRSWGNHTQGHWSIASSVYFTPTNPATQGFAVGNAPEAGILLSSLAEPPGLGIGRLHRWAQGTWDSTGLVPTHTGSAGPQ